MWEILQLFGVLCSPILDYVKVLDYGVYYYFVKIL